MTTRATHLLFVPIALLALLANMALASHTAHAHARTHAADVPENITLSLSQDISNKGVICFVLNAKNPDDMAAVDNWSKGYYRITSWHTSDTSDASQLIKAVNKPFDIGTTKTVDPTPNPTDCATFHDQTLYNQTIGGNGGYGYFQVTFYTGQSLALGQEPSDDPNPGDAWGQSNVVGVAEVTGTQINGIPLLRTCYDSSTDTGDDCQITDAKDVDGGTPPSNNDQQDNGDTSDYEPFGAIGL